MKKNKNVLCRSERMKNSWKRRIILEKNYTETCAEWMAQRLEALVEYMQYGHALIAYRKQNGTFCLAKGTLIYYETEFKRKYDATRIQSAVVYWDVDLQAWRTFQLENFMEWKPVV